LVVKVEGLGVPAQRDRTVGLSVEIFLQRVSKKDFHYNPSRGAYFLKLELYLKC